MPDLVNSFSTKANEVILKISDEHLFHINNLGFVQKLKKKITCSAYDVGLLPSTKNNNYFNVL